MGEDNCEQEKVIAERFEAVALDQQTGMLDLQNKLEAFNIGLKMIYEAADMAWPLDVTYSAQAVFLACRDVVIKLNEQKKG